MYIPPCQVEVFHIVLMYNVWRCWRRRWWRWMWWFWCLVFWVVLVGEVLVVLMVVEMVMGVPYEVPYFKQPSLSSRQKLQ